MNLIKVTPILFLLFLCSSCTEYEKIMGPALKAKMEDKNPNPVFDGEAEPPMPSPSENDKTLLGIDANKNGIRDDIDIWINRTGKTYNERMALRQLAKALREEWIAGNMAYDNYKKGPIDVFDPKQNDYDKSIGKLVQAATSLEWESSACIDFFFIEPFYDSKEPINLVNVLTILLSNSSLRKESLKSYYQYNHIYGPANGGKEKNEYCLFNVKELDLAKLNYENALRIRREKSGYKYDKK